MPTDIQKAAIQAHVEEVSTTIDINAHSALVGLIKDAAKARKFDELDQLREQYSAQFANLRLIAGN